MLRPNEKPLGHAENLTNCRFGKVIALYRVQDDGKHTAWRCKCDCGKEFETLAQSLKNGATKSCGCDMQKVREENGRNRKNDICGQRFGNLTVLQDSGKRKNRKVLWTCQCDCGNIVDVTTSNLRTGHTTSCGCITSQGEQKIAALLHEAKLKFVTQKTFDSCVNPTTKHNLRFDFYVNNTYLIEFDGVQHFKEDKYFRDSLIDRQTRDKIKDVWCKEHHIPLIRIPYTHLKDLSIDDLQLTTSRFIV